MNKQFVRVLGLLGFSVLGAGVILIHPAITLADPPPSVTICHATASDANPYVTQSPNIQNDGSLTGGHLDHTGGLYPADNWGDIIPAYTSGNFSYPGLNVPAGQAILDNNCIIPSETPRHRVCDNRQCKVVDGEGSDSCSLDEDCIEDTITPTNTPTPTPTPTPGNPGGPGDGLSDGRSDGRSSCPECTKAPQGEVLGATTDFAATGVTEDLIMNAIGAMGGISTAAGLALIAKKKSN